MTNEINLIRPLLNAINFLQGRQIIPGRPSGEPESPEDSFELCAFTPPPESSPAQITISGTGPRRRSVIFEAIQRLSASLSEAPPAIATKLTALTNAFRQGRTVNSPITISRADLKNYIKTIQELISHLQEVRSTRHSEGR